MNLSHHGTSPKLRHGVGALQCRRSTAGPVANRLRGTVPRLTLRSVVLVGALAALACGEGTTTREETLGVASAPPNARATPQDGPIDRDRMAREAFDRWAPLIAGGAVDDARALCEAWLGMPDHGHHAEAHKCLANVTIATMRKPAAQGGPAVGNPAPPLSNAGVERALTHYEKALTLTPLDQDAHLGRVDLLILAGRYREANAQLDESLSAFESRAMLDQWFKLLGRFQRAGTAHEGLAYLQVIERHHPLDHRVASNLGAFYAMTGNDEEALAQLERAVTINPDDPYNHWNLARIYDKRERLEDADRHYQEALAVMNRDDSRARCDYAKFLATRIADETRACEYARTQCPELHDRNCGPKAEHAEAQSPPTT